MVAHSGRRGQAVDFSHYLDNLNVIIPTDEPSPDNTSYDDNAGLEIFTQQDFVDWDAQPLADLHEPVKADAPKTQTTMPDAEVVSTSPVGGLNVDFPMPDEFSHFDFGFPNPSPSGVHNFSDNLATLPSLQPNPAPGYPPAGAQQHPYSVPSPQTGGKRLSNAGQHRQLSLEEQSRLAAEEDKRRRNTAASARFRVKKKAREQALEKREKELTDEVSQMKNRITHLETENKWLRGLVMEKTGKDSKFDAKLTAFLKSMNRDSSDSESEPESKSKRTKVQDKAK